MLKKEERKKTKVCTLINSTNLRLSLKIVLSLGQEKSPEVGATATPSQSQATFARRALLLPSDASPEGNT